MGQECAKAMASLWQPLRGLTTRSRQGKWRSKINHPALYPCEEFATWTDLDGCSLVPLVAVEDIEKNNQSCI